MLMWQHLPLIISCTLRCVVLLLLLLDICADVLQAQIPFTGGMQLLLLLPVQLPLLVLLLLLPLRVLLRILLLLLNGLQCTPLLLAVCGGGGCVCSQQHVRALACKGQPAAAGSLAEGPYA
jgi:hypothetical protein